MGEVKSPAKSGVRVDAYTKATRRHVYPSDKVLGDMFWVQVLYATHPHIQINTHLVSLIKNPQILPISPPAWRKIFKGELFAKPQSIGDEIYFL